jgi:hypothetical protein
MTVRTAITSAHGKLISKYLLECLLSDRMDHQLFPPQQAGAGP